MGVIRYIVLAMIAILLNGCATKAIPLQASVNVIEVKIENPKSGKQYTLLSSSNEGVIDKQYPSSSGIIDFNISRSSKDVGKCFFVSDGEKLIPLNGSIYKFSNSVFNDYYDIKYKLDNTNSSLEKYKNLLSSSYSYRNGQCVLLSANDIPKKPSNACSPQEEGTFSYQQCQNLSVKTDTGDKIVNSLISGGVGLVAGAIAGPFGGIAAGVVSDLVLDSRDKEKKYNECLENSRSNCRYYYNNWASIASEIQNNPEKLHKQCVDSKQNIDNLLVSQNNLNSSLYRMSQSWVSITEQNYCY